MPNFDVRSGEPATAASAPMPGPPWQIEAPAALYRPIAAGRLDARKLDAKTVITAESIGQLIAELPKAGRQT